MIGALRIVLSLAFAAVFATLVAASLAWLFEPARRLRIALKRALGVEPQSIAVDTLNGRACGVDFDSESLAVLWKPGGDGLIFAFAEIDGAELIVDGKVVARAQRGQPRRIPDSAHSDASQVVLRLMFNLPRWPEFELELLSDAPQAERQSPAEAVRLGRLWVGHVGVILSKVTAPPEPATGAPPPSQQNHDENAVEASQDG